MLYSFCTGIKFTTTTTTTITSTTTGVNSRIEFAVGTKDLKLCDPLLLLLVSLLTDSRSWIRGDSRRLQAAGFKTSLCCLLESRSRFLADEF